MKAREIFSLVVRAIGVWAVVMNIGPLLLAVGVFKATMLPFFSTLLQIVAGFYCLAGAPLLVNYAYPPGTSHDSTKTNSP